MSKRRCVIIGSSPETDIDIIRKHLREGDFIACADGGYVYAEQLGIKPDMIIGDFDSSERPDTDICRIIELPVRKDDTDTVYTVRECLRLGFEEFLLFGMTGGRIDHTYANLCVLADLAKKQVRASLIDKENTIEVIYSGSRIIENRNGCGFAVFPFGCESCNVSLEGFEYNLQAGTLTADFPLGVSNTIRSDKAKITVHNGMAVTMCNVQCAMMTWGSL